jgi:outer membrane protein assembly factor BamB
MIRQVFAAVAFAVLSPAPLWANAEAESLLADSGVKGGLVVHVGCGDGKLTATLCANERFLVHGLTFDRDSVDAARKHIDSLGLSGRVTVEQWQSKSLPYRGGLVNLLVVEQADLVASDEIARVLCPGGVAYVASMTERSDVEFADRWRKIEKPWPDDIDEWTHFLYDATGNAVAKDKKVASPRHVQWRAGPKRTRDHDALASFTTMTSAAGRVFYIIDEGPTSQIHRQPRWRLVARDAFNGVRLWKRRLDSWVTHLYNFRAGPVQMTRRLVSIGDNVYVTLGYDAPISVLDAATGKTMCTLEGSTNTEELIVQDNVLLAVLGNPKVFDDEAPKIDGYWETKGEDDPKIVKSIAAYNAGTGARLWTKTNADMDRLAPLSLSASGGLAFYLDREHLHGIDLETGDDVWQSHYASEGLYLRNYAPTVAVAKEVIVCLSLDKIAAFSTQDGKPLWRKEQGFQGFGSPGDLFIVNGLVWTFPHTQGVSYADKKKVLGNGGSEFCAFDLTTGELKRSIAKADVWPGGHHHRCYRNKATENFAVCGRRGLEFVDLTGSGRNTINWWVRGICQYGIMPCNGMVYAPQDPCQCFSSIKVDGLLALAADDAATPPTRGREPALIRGPAFGNENSAGEVEGEANEWPTYRRDTARSGSTTVSIPAKLQRLWQFDVDGAPSGVVVARNRALVSAVDKNTLYCLDGDRGDLVWKYVARGAVDSPPTIHAGLALFGGRAGHVYAVNLESGQLAWSFRAGDRDLRIMDDDRLESVTPIHGSVLVLDDVAYFSAGRSSFLDGGIRLYGLDVHSGEKRYETLVESTPIGGNTRGALPDILASDGTMIHMRQLSFDKELSNVGGGKRGSFTATTGFLEDEWGHRLTWRTGNASGNLLVFDGEFIYGAESRYSGWKKNKANWPSTHSGHLHQKYSRYKSEWFPIGNRVFARNRNAPKNSRRTGESNAASGWSIDMPIQVRTLSLAGETLFAAGWPDAVTLRDRAEPGASERELRDSKLWAISAKNGSTEAEYDLESPPVFDGAAAAYGRLFLPLQNGTIVCFGGK